MIVSHRYLFLSWVSGVLRRIFCLCISVWFDVDLCGALLLLKIEGKDLPLLLFYLIGGKVGKGHPFFFSTCIYVTCPTFFHFYFYFEPPVRRSRARKFFRYYATIPLRPLYLLVSIHFLLPGTLLHSCLSTIFLFESSLASSFSSLFLSLAISLLWLGYHQLYIYVYTPISCPPSAISALGLPPSTACAS